MSDPSRKNVRFSGNTSGNRVRFVRRVSTSVSAKSVFTVSDASVFAPSRCVTSRLASAVPRGALVRPRLAGSGRDGWTHAEPDPEIEARERP